MENTIIQEINYFYPRLEIIDWQEKDEKLPKELLNHLLCFLKYNFEQKRIETSKNGSIDFNFAYQMFKVFKDKIEPNIKENVYYGLNYKGINLGAILQKGKIIIQFGCMYFTLDNLLFVLNQGK